MSIRILRDVNGAFGDFAAHDIVVGLSPVQEAALVSNNEAEEVLAQIGLLTPEQAAAASRSAEYHLHFYAPLVLDGDTKARDISGALSHGNLQANLSASAAWATAGFLTQPNPSVANNLSLVAFPPLSWDWVSGDSLFIFWAGRATPEGANAPLMGDTSGFAAGNGVKIICTTAGKLNMNVYQASGSVSVFGATSTETAFEASVTHSFAICITPSGIAYWVDGARAAGHAAGFLMPANGPCDTVNAVPFKLGGDGSTTASVQNGVAAQTRALVILKGRRGKAPAVADIDALVAQLHANPLARVSSGGW